MTRIDLLRPEDYRRIPWKNGRGEMVVIDREGGDSWSDTNGKPSVAWHFGRTAIVEEGPFSDYTGYERLQVVIGGAGLVLVAPDHEIDLRIPMVPQRYDGGTPIRTRLEQGPVEVVNLIAVRERFDIDLRVGGNDAALPCAKGVHVMYAPAADAAIDIDGHRYALADGHALRLRTAVETNVMVRSGAVLVGSIYAKS